MWEAYCSEPVLPALPFCSLAKSHAPKRKIETKIYSDQITINAYCINR